MKNLYPTLVELLVMFGVYLCALIMTASFRRRQRPGRSAGSPLTTSLRALGAFLALPVFVLILSTLLVWVLPLDRESSTWLARHSNHVTAWYTFWLVVLLVNLVEGAVSQVFLLRGRVFPIPDLLLNIVRALVIIAAGFAILRIELEINIAPLLASTALVTAVIGFALQGVLGNLLAGMSLHIVRSVVPSDWAKIGDVEGEVLQTNWRETRLRTVSGHIMVIPNSKVAESVIHNMTRPDNLRRHVVNVGASYSDAPGEVIDALLQSALAVPAVEREPAPSAYVTEYKDFGINYQLRFWSRVYHDRTPIEGDVGRMIWYQFKRRGIEIPFPMSDKLLNDFMEVVYNQRRMQPEETEVRRRISDLMDSDFCTKLCVDEKGDSLVDARDLEQVVRSVNRVRFTQGEVMFRQGDAGSTFYVIVQGRVRGRVEHEDSTPANEFELGAGAVFGEMSLMTGTPRTATITVSEEAEFLEIGQDAFGKLLSLHDNIPEILSRLVAERAAQNEAALDKLKSLKSPEVTQQIQRGSILQRFLRMMKRSGAKP